MKLKSEVNKGCSTVYEDISFVCPSCSSEYLLERDDIGSIAKLFTKRRFYKRTDVNFFKYLCLSILGEGHKETRQGMVCVDTNCPKCQYKIQVDISAGEEMPPEPIRGMLP